MDTDISVPLYPDKRYSEVLGCKNSKTKIEKYLVWRLLEFGVKNYTTFNFDNLQFTKNANGKWVCPDLYFSLSHADGMVCVALSDTPIGVDAEPVREIRRELGGRIMTDKELSLTKDMPKEDLSEYLLSLWVKKESIFKTGDVSALMPRSIEAQEHPTSLRRVTLGTQEYLISVCHTRAHEIEFKYVEEI